MAKSFRQRKKEIRDYIGLIRKTLNEEDVPGMMLDKLEKELSTVKESTLREWHSRFAKRAGSLLARMKDGSRITLIQGALRSIETLVGGIR